MNAGDERRYWRAVNALKQAEALAALASTVSGPADAPPKADPDAWADDWTSRAKRALKQARDWVDDKSGHKFLRERAFGIARNVQKGANALRAIPGQFKTKTRKAIESVRDAAGAFMLGSFALTWLIPAIILFAWYRSSKGKSTHGSSS